MIDVQYRCEYDISCTPCGKTVGLFLHRELFCLPRGAVAAWPFTQGAVRERRVHCCQLSKGHFYTGHCLATWQISSKICAAARWIGSWAQFAAHCQTAAHQCKDACWNQLDPINGTTRQCREATQRRGALQQNSALCKSSLMVTEPNTAWCCHDMVFFFFKIVTIDTPTVHQLGWAFGCLLLG